MRFFRGNSLYQAIKRHLNNIIQELCESRGGRTELSVPNEPSGFRGRIKDLLNRASTLVTTCP